MLEDRDYMRPTYGRATAPSLTILLLIANVVAFVVQNVAAYYLPELEVERRFALSLDGLRAGYIWQPITFQFMHAGLLHLLVNLITIYFFGRPLEEALGRGGFLKLYFGSGVFGGLLQLLASLALPQHFGRGGVLGASAGAFGLVAAFAALWPERPLTLLLFFVVPVSLRAKVLLYFELGLALFGIAVPLDNVAHVAHLGGIVVGLAAVRWRALTRWTWTLPGRVRAARPPRAFAGVKAARSGRPGPRPAAVDLPPAEFISREVDPILDKISAHGIQSLTPEERRILEAASAKIGRR